VFGPLAVFRFVDGDEGVYAYASRLALHGHVPYRDFFYEQMPLLPYVYGAWIGVLGGSWYTIRSLSALLGIATGALLSLSAARRGRTRGAVGLAAAFVPTFVLLAPSPHAFVFDNLRYHGEKTSHGLVGDPGQKVRTAANLVGFGNADHALGLQFALLLVGSAAALWLLRRRLPFAAAVGVSLGVASFLPRRT